MAKYYVYVIDLDEKVANHKRFRSKNPKYIKGNGCGMSVNPQKARNSVRAT